MTETATGILREEHQLILAVADVLDRIVGGDPTGTVPDLGSVQECVSFFKLYADACHHAKEEDLLFVELEEQGMPSDQGPIGVMLHEHQLGRQFVAGMQTALDTIGSGDDAAHDELRSWAREYVDLITAHIGKEDNILFEMADNMITGEGCRVLCDGYTVACAKRFGGKTRDELEALAGRLTARHPA